MAEKWRGDVEIGGNSKSDFVCIHEIRRKEIKSSGPTQIHFHAKL